MKITSMEIVDFLPDIKDLPNGTRYGMFSCVTPQGVRYVKYNALREWEGEKDTEPAFTRAFLHTLPKAKCRKSQRAAFESTRPPLYVRPGFVENAVYIDMRSAFPSIYSRLGWRVEYLRGKYFIPTEPLLWPYPQSWKVGRSYVVTGARPQQSSLYVYNGKLCSTTHRSAFSNPSMVCAVYDTLSAFARLATYSFDASYWNIDGGIFEEKRGLAFARILEELGFDARIKHSGAAGIFSAGLWYIGKHTTKKAEKPGVRTRPIYGDRIPINVKNSEWLIERWYKWKPRIISPS